MPTYVRISEYIPLTGSLTTASLFELSLFNTSSNTYDSIKLTLDQLKLYNSTGSFTGSFNGNLTGTGSWSNNSISSSYSLSSSFSNNSLSSSYVPTASNIWIDRDTVQTLTDGATIQWNVSGGISAAVTLAGNRALQISSSVAGHYYTLRVIQDNTGSRSLTLPSPSKVANGGSGSVSLSTGTGSIDILTVFYDGSTYWWTYGLNFT